MSSKSKPSRKSELPWWVEFLFVQVGLPDYLLRFILKVKKSARQSIANNKKPIGLFVLTFFIILYLNPIVKKAKLNNTCIQKTESYITKTLKSDRDKKHAEVSIVAHNFCNGGSLNDY